MSFFTPEEITDITVDAVNSFTDSVIIERVSSNTGIVSSDGAGGRTVVGADLDGWTTVTTVMGLLTTSRMTPREREIAIQTQAPVTYWVFLPLGTDVRAQDRLVVDSRTFECQGVLVMASVALAMKTYCVEIQ